MYIFPDLSPLISLASPQTAGAGGIPNSWVGIDPLPPSHASLSGLARTGLFLLIHAISTGKTTVILQI